MRSDPATRARACFALARSTAFPAERSVALAKGLRILDQAGLDPGLFNIPGREKAAPRPAQFTAKPKSMDDVFKRFEQTLAAARDRASAHEDETPFDARVRNFAAAVADAVGRDRARQSC